MDEIFNKYYNKMGKKFCSKINIVVQALLKRGKASTYDIGKELCLLNNSPLLFKRVKSNE